MTENRAVKICSDDDVPLRVVKDYFEQNPKQLNAIQGPSGTALHAAVASRSYAKVELLLKLGADPNIVAPGDDCLPAMFVAMGGDDKKLLTLLMDGGCDINARDFRNSHVLHYLGHLNDADNDPAAIIHAYFELAASKGLDVEVNARATIQSTPLHVALSKKMTGTVLLLLLHGADVNAVDEDGWTPLHFAVNKGHVPSVLLLLDHGANMEVRTTDEHCVLASEMPTSPGVTRALAVARRRLYGDVVL